MTTLFLIRHGDNDYLRKNILPGRLPGVHLNEHGQQQAADLARTLCLLPLKAIYSSPLERAIETATPLANLQKLEIKIIPDLADTDVGNWAGRSWKALDPANAIAVPVSGWGKFRRGAGARRGRATFHRRGTRKR
jgi:broad specificity phosphatase PhoE